MVRAVYSEWETGIQKSGLEPEPSNNCHNGDELHLLPRVRDRLCVDIAHSDYEFQLIPSGCVPALRQIRQISGLRRQKAQTAGNGAVPERQRKRARRGGRGDSGQYLRLFNSCRLEVNP